jgi:hypothetical protein
VPGNIGSTEDSLHAITSYAGVTSSEIWLEPVRVDRTAEESFVELIHLRECKRLQAREVKRLLTKIFLLAGSGQAIEPLYYG